MDKRLEMFKTGRIVVHCDTEEKARKFVDWCYKNEIQWQSANQQETHFDMYGNLTCYRYSSCLGYEEYDFYERNGFQIMSFDEFMGGTDMFTKDDLKTGMLVKTRNGEVFKVFPDYETDRYGKTGILTDETGSFIYLPCYDSDLTTIEYGNEYDIVAVYKPSLVTHALSFNIKNHFLVWRRKEVKEMTMEQLNELLGYEVKIVQ